MTMLRAWGALGHIPLKVVGHGPLLTETQHSSGGQPCRHVEFLGHRPRERPLKLMKGARFPRVPSECYENFPMSISEAFASGCR